MQAELKAYGQTNLRLYEEVARLSEAAHGDSISEDDMARLDAADLEARERLEMQERLLAESAFRRRARSHRSPAPQHARPRAAPLNTRRRPQLWRMRRRRASFWKRPFVRRRRLRNASGRRIASKVRATSAAAAAIQPP